MTATFFQTGFAGDTDRARLLVSAAAYALVLLVFIADWYSPTLVVVGLAYEAPVVFAALRGTKRLTIQVVSLGMFGLALGWFTDFAAASYTLNEDRIENRLLCAISLLLVGSLTLVLQKVAARTGRESDQRMLLRRDAALTAAADRIGSSPSLDTVVPALTGEAPAVLEAPAVAWSPLHEGESFWLSEYGAGTARRITPAKASALSKLAERVASERSFAVLPPQDTFDRLVDSSGTTPFPRGDVLAVPVTSGSRAFGVFLAAFDGHIDDGIIVSARSFARYAAHALERAELLAGRGDPHSNSPR